MEAITVSKASGPGTLSGTSSVAAVSGVATFNGLQFDQIGTYSLSTTSGTLTPNTSSSIVISPSPVTYNFTAPTAANIPANLTVSTMTVGNSFGSTSMITGSSVSSGYTGATGGNNAGVPANIGSLNVSTSTNAYFEFTLTPNSNYVVTLNGISFGTRSTTSGPQAFSLRTNKDNYATNIATGSISNNSAWTIKTPTVSSISSNAGAPIIFRLYGYNGGSTPTSGTVNWRIDDVLLNLTVSACAQPNISVNSGSICTGNSFTISPTGGVTYSVTGTNFTVNPTANTDYTVTGADAIGCTNTAVSAVVVNTVPVVSVNSGSIAIGASFTMTPTGAATYTFSSGTAVVSPTINTTYTVTGTSTEGCVSLMGTLSSVTVVPIPLTQLTSASCNTSLTVMDASVRLYCNGISGATNYEWQFTDVSTGLVVFTKQRGFQWTDFYLTGYWPYIQYNKTYSIKVRAKVGSTWGNYGTACTITTPTAGLVPTELTSTYCNTTLSSFNSSTTIRCNQVTGATNYEWKFTDVSNPSLVYTRVRNAQWSDFYLASIPQLSANKTYSVVVRAYVNGTWGTFANACTITIPATFARFALSDYEETEIGANIINVNAYPNPSTEILNIDFDNMPADASVEIYNMIGELVLAQPLTDMNNIINTSQLSNGLYHTKVIGNNKLLYAQKIVKQ
jgi:hypothetical protein